MGILRSVRSAKFKRQLLSLPPELQQRTRKAYRLFLQDPFHPSFRRRIAKTEFSHSESEISVVGIGGTITNLASVKLGLKRFDREKVHGLILTAHEIDRLIELFCSMPLEKRREITGLEPERADVIISGAIVFKAILEVIECPQITVSARGLRYGLAYEFLF